MLETLLGRPIADNEAISVRAADTSSAPDWLRRSWQSAEEDGVDSLSAEDIEAEITAARNAKSS